MPLVLALILLLGDSSVAADDFGDALNGALARPHATAATPVETPTAGPDQDMLMGIDEGVRTAVEFLTARQRADGSWGNVTAGMTGSFTDSYEPALDDPYSRVAITALVLEGLEKAGANAPGQIAKGRKFVIEHGLLDPDDPKIKKDLEAFGAKLGNNFRPYALGYGLAFVSRGSAVPDREKLIKAYLDKIKAADARGEFGYTGRGGDQSSFQLAVVANGLLDAKAPAEAVKPFLERLELMRSPDGSFLYESGSTPMPKREDNEASSAGRSLPCELAFYRSNPTGDRLKALEKAIWRWHANYPKIHAVAENAGFGHKPPYGHARYYDLFSVYWASEALAKMSVLPARDRGMYVGIANELTRSLLKDRSTQGEKDAAGSKRTWRDEIFVGGRNYGTASALVALTNLRAFFSAASTPR